MDVLMIRNIEEDQQGLGKCLGVEEEQQGHHNRKEIKSNSACQLHFGLQDQSALKWTPKMHPDSDCDGLDMVVKIRRLSNQSN
jgi:hypothetical protein